MSFSAVLAELVADVPGAQGAILADREGEAIDQAGNMDVYDLQIMAAHQGVLLENLYRVACRLGDRHLSEVVITTSRMQTLLLPVAGDYFLLLACERHGSLGLALYEARRTRHALHDEIA